MSAAIHDSTNPSYPSLLHMILATIIPVQQRIRVGTTVEKHVGPAAGSLTRAVLSWGTTVGVGLLLLKVFGKTHQNSDDEEEEEEGNKNSLWSILRDMVGMSPGCSKKNRRSKNKSSKPSTPKSLFPMSSSSLEEVVTHEGSCHCGSICFEVKAPRCLTLHFPQDENDSSDDQQQQQLDASFDLASVVSSVRRQQGAAIHYPSAKVEASGFSLLQGQEQWKTYHVQVTNRDDDGTQVVTKAYSFCRVCAVHLLHASDDDAFSISINVHTLTTPWTTTQEEQAKDAIVYHEEEEEQVEFTYHPPARSSRAGVHKQPKTKQRKQKQQRHPAAAPTRNVVTPQQGDVAVEISNSGSTEGGAQQRRRRKSGNPSSSSYMVPNNPLSTGVDWPVGVDQDDEGDAGAFFERSEEESTISSTTTTSSHNQPLLGGGESSIPSAADATTATTMTSTTLESGMMMEQQQQQQQQQQQPSRDISGQNNMTTAATTTDPVKLRQYMAKHLKKKNKTLA